jgi:hypothetical protein
VPSGGAERASLVAGWGESAFNVTRKLSPLYSRAYRNGAAYICSRKQCVRVTLEPSLRIRSHPHLGPVFRIVSRQTLRLTPPMISIVAAMLERLRCSSRIITPAVATTNGTGINVCKAAVDVTLPKGCANLHRPPPWPDRARELDATTSRQNIQLMSKHRLLNFEPQLRFEWRTKTANGGLGDSGTSSTRIRFPVPNNGGTSSCARLYRAW